MCRSALWVSSVKTQDQTCQPDTKDKISDKSRHYHLGRMSAHVGLLGILADHISQKARQDISDILTLQEKTDRQGGT
ncbi:hypothetical protein ElyMa_003415400 [Elysia marginata]|uniref:Uncharacterized protein n=1 Tax=Elysia marginata TaxID=1093978 RepID=A0AAV4JRU4_9GAST|nr:hypothetical protein ElyMa_003415400 [Elysia marginata]